MGKLPPRLSDDLDDATVIHKATEHVICKLQVPVTACSIGSNIRDVQLDIVETDAFGESLEQGGWLPTEVINICHHYIS